MDAIETLMTEHRMIEQVLDQFGMATADLIASSFPDDRSQAAARQAQHIVGRKGDVIGAQQGGGVQDLLA